MPNMQDIQTLQTMHAAMIAKVSDISSQQANLEVQKIDWQKQADSLGQLISQMQIALTDNLPTNNEQITPNVPSTGSDTPSDSPSSNSGVGEPSTDTAANPETI